MTASKPGALVLAPLSPAQLERLKGMARVYYEPWTETRTLVDPDELAQRVQSDDMPIVVAEADFFFEDVFEAAEKLRFLGICRGEVNQVDVDAATEHGVMVANTPARNAASVAELAVGLMIALARNIPAADGMVRSGGWDDPVGPYLTMRGVELAGKTVGIVGLGAVGAETARRLRAFDMKLLAYDPYASEEKAREAGVHLTDLDSLMKESDFVSLHCTSSPETAGMIDEHKLGLMKPGSYLVNTARWEVVDAAALLDTLKNRRIAGAAFDVFESHPVPRHSPLLQMDNVILTPHLGGATEGTIARYSRMIVDDIERFLNGGQPVNLVNPEVLRHAKQVPAGD